ncbi:hypothetical protein F0562_033896 [Nyssa sinensis]|uniref:Nucleolar protein 14 n=1 Tax=Nyssa sinensis TaxID=561372 RepID=A0A5J5AE51_9ASTE|nr:hypothetical protein F0562_033896 [Nyssa sinensis]
MAKQGTDKKKKNKKKNKSGPNVVAMKSKAPKSNPFETIWSRRKFDILGKKRKGEEKRIGLARSLAIEKRKKTLLKEYEQSGKSSVFLDKRIGEQNDSLGEFDKAILRSQRERQMKLNKRSKYNLSDGEEDEFELQGGGSFPVRDDFEEEVPFDDDDDVEVTESSAILQLNGHDSRSALEMGLMEGEENRQKTKKEVMEEIISKSKFFKAQKAKDKEENEQLIEQLDKNFTSLVQSEALLSLTQPNKMNALKALVNKSISNEYLKKDEASAPQNKDPLQQEKPDSYDKLVKEMVLDMRARPSDRTKTPEEIAQEEKERLEQLEEERQKRMLATDDISDEDGNASEDDDNTSAHAQRLRSISGDDLGDLFSHDEEPRTKKGWIDEILKRENAKNLESEESSEGSESAEEDGDEEGSDEDDEKCEHTKSLKDWEQSDDDLGTDLEEEEDDEEEDDDGGDEEMEPKGSKKASEIKEKQFDVEKTKANSNQLSAQQGELPYVIEAPKSLEEFSSLLVNRSDYQIVEAIRRIRMCNAITVAAENRKKMQVFYGVLLQYFAVSANKKPLNFKLLNLLVKPLMEMSVEIPYFAAICARQRLLQTRTKFCEDAKNPEKSCWPSLKTLFLLRLWSMIFPCSDFRHAVMTPALLLMCEYLLRCPIMSGRDIAVGSFICSMVLSVTKQSRKFCPEAITFLETLLMAAVDRKPGLCQHSQLYRPLLCVRGCVNEISPLDFLNLMDMPDDSPFFSSDNFRASMLVCVIETLRGFVNVYEGFSSFPEIFTPISKILLELAEQEHMQDALQDKIRDVTLLIEKKTHEHHLLRRPLQMRKQKPVPIKLLNPKFEENFVKGRDYDPDRERAEKRKLKKLVKREAKGAARELRKDSYFIFGVKEKEKEEGKMKLTLGGCVTHPTLDVLQLLPSRHCFWFWICAETEVVVNCPFQIFLKFAAAIAQSFCKEEFSADLYMFLSEETKFISFSFVATPFVLFKQRRREVLWELQYAILDKVYCSFPLKKPFTSVLKFSFMVTPAVIFISSEIPILICPERSSGLQAFSFVMYLTTYLASIGHESVESAMNYVVEKLKELLLVLENFGGDLLNSLDKLFPPETTGKQLHHWIQVAAPFVIAGVVLLMCICCCRCCCRHGGRGIRMMKAPGRDYMMPRHVFESNPQSYFSGLRSSTVLR